MDASHAARIKQELVDAGVTRYGFMKSEAKHIAPLIHEDEHIGGAVYGQINGTDTAFLFATDKRIIFFDRKPLYSTFDELTYDVVAGVQVNRAGPGASIVLHTRVRDYNLRYVNQKCASIFTNYLEKRTLEGGVHKEVKQEAVQLETPKFDTGSKAQGLKFLKEHDLGVLSTVDRTGNVHGAVVYYLVDTNNFVYILTKAGTDKGRNVYAHDQVALTIHKNGTQQTLQLQGTAQVETNQVAKEKVFSLLIKTRSYKDGADLPPVAKLKEGAFMVIKITPTMLSFRDYAK